MADAQIERVIAAKRQELIRQMELVFAGHSLPPSYLDRVLRELAQRVLDIGAQHLIEQGLPDGTVWAKELRSLASDGAQEKTK